MEAPKILTVDDFDEIRDRIGKVSSVTLPDEVICKTSYLMRAEAIIRQAVPTYETILLEDGDDTIFLKSAVIALTAAYLIPRVKKQYKSESIGGDYSYTAIDEQEWVNKEKSLKKEYAANIGSIAGYESTVNLVALAGPTRQEESEA
jgi:hypothetical protein